MILPIRIPPNLIWPYASGIWKTQVVNPATRHMLDVSRPPMMWVNGVRMDRAVAETDSVMALRDGAFTWHDDHFIFSMPQGLVPTDPACIVVVGVPMRPVRLAAVEPSRSTPCFIVGPQRSGTTALGWALHQGSRYRLPQHALNHTHTTEGYLLRQMLGAFAFEPMLRMGVAEGEASLAVGVDRFGNRFQGFSTGIFADTGHACAILFEIARAAEAAVGHAAQSPGAWTEKSPGWENLATVPLAHALFPGASTLFMSREPGSGVLSQLRLRQIDFTSLPESREDLGCLGAAIAEWVLAHHYWRRFVAPHLPAGRSRVIPFSVLRREPSIAVAMIAEVIGLTAPEQQRTVAALGDAPVAIHQDTKSEDLLRLQRLIRRLAWSEAAHWGYPAPEPVDVAPEVLSPILKQFGRAFLSLSQDLGVPGVYTDAVLAHHARTATELDQASPDLTAEQAADAELPKSQPAPLLAALLDIAAAQGGGPTFGATNTGRPVHHIAPASSAAAEAETAGDEGTLSGVSVAAVAAVNAVDAVDAVAAGGRGQDALAPRAERGRHSAEQGSSAGRSITAEPVGGGGDAEPPQSLRLPRILLQRYAGRRFQPQDGAVGRRLSVRGWFHEPASDVRFPWTATVTRRRGHWLHLACSFNGHPGTARIGLNGRYFTGLLTMSGRVDVVEGRLERGGTVAFDRWYLREDG